MAMPRSLRCTLAAALLLAAPAQAQQAPRSDPSGQEYLAIMQAEVAELETKREALEAEVRKATDALAAARDEAARRAAKADADTARSRKAEKEYADAQARLRALGDEIDSQQARRTATEQDVATVIDSRRAELEHLDARTGASRAALAHAEAETATAEAALATLRGDLAQRQTILATLESNAKAAAQREKDVLARIAAAQAQLQALEEQANRRRTEAEALDVMTAEVAEARTASTGANARLQSLNAAIAAREAELARLDAALAALPPAAPSPVVPSGGAGARSEAVVAATVAAAPGLADSTPAQRAALVAALESGTCVTDALTGAIGSINRQAAAALIRGLGGC